MAYKRSFSDQSWWNAVAINVPVDPKSSQYIAGQAKVEGADHIEVSTGNWRFFWGDSAHSGSLTTIKDKRGASVKLHAPAKADVMAGDDKALGLRCFGCDVEVQLFEAVQKDATNWTCTNFAAYRPSSLGISGTQGNKGHRGIAPSAMFIAGEEIADGVIRHRLKFALGPPGDNRLDGKSMPIWPLDGYEKPRAGVIPEGAVLRLKTSAFERVNPKGTSLVVATAAHDYGLVVGDTGGHATIKTQLNATFPKDISSALDAFKWADYEVLQLGWGKG